MKQFKLTFVLTMLMSMVGLKSFAAWDTSTKIEVGGLYYYLDNDKHQALVTSMPSGKYTGAIEIPSSFTYNQTTYSVTGIVFQAFHGCSGLTSVTIPNSVTDMGNPVFSNCPSLTSMVVESGNPKYDSRNNCNAIIETASNTLIEGCKNTTIPNSVTSIRSSAFSGCSGLTSVTIPNSVTSIGNSAFFDCSGLTSVTIPNSVTSIGHWAFHGCYSLSSIVVESGNTVYDSRNNCNAIIETASNTLLAGCNNTTIPNGVTSIGEYAFYHCSGFTFVTIPNSVTSIGRWAFASCSGLTSVPIGNSVTSIGDYAFYQCSGLTSINIPNSVTSIGNCAFHACSKLTSVTIGNSVTSIGAEAFSSCSGLTSIVVESGNTKYDSRNNCNAIIETASNTLLYGSNNTTIPNSVTSIGSYAFISCSGLTSVTIPKSVTSIGEGAFFHCDGLTSITIPNSVTSIGKVAFKCCFGLTSVTIPNSVTSIGTRAFEGCYSLSSIVVESGNTVYDSRNNCNAIIETVTNTLIAGCKNTVIHNSVTSIGDFAFSLCYGFTSINIPNSVTSIGEEAFSFCDDLSSVTIGSGVTSIGWAAFAACSKLVSVTALNPTPVAITEYEFSNRKYATLYVPKGSKDAYKAAAYWKQFKEIIEIETTGIDQISFQENGEQGVDQKGAVWYTIDGKRVDKPKKGINIIRMSDGTTKKVVVK